MAQKIVLTEKLPLAKNYSDRDTRLAEFYFDRDTLFGQKILYRDCQMKNNGPGDEFVLNRVGSMDDLRQGEWGRGIQEREAASNKYFNSKTSQYFWRDPPAKSSTQRRQYLKGSLHLFLRGST